jgi:hypothetical protein
MCPVVQGVVAIGVGGASGEDAEVDDDAHDVNEALTGGHMQRRLHLLVEAVAALSPDLEEHTIGSPEQDGYWEEQVEHSLATMLPQQEGHWDEWVEQGE